MAAQFSAKMEALRLHRRAFEDALLRVERVARSSLNKAEQNEPRRESVQIPSSPSTPTYNLAQVQGNMLKSTDNSGSNPSNSKGNGQTSSSRPESRKNNNRNEHHDDKVIGQGGKGDNNHDSQRKASSGKNGVTKAPSNNDLKAIMSLPDPDEERSHETLIAARHALWQQSYLRIQSWLRASEAITMDAEHNRAIHRELGDLIGEDSLISE